MLLFDLDGTLWDSAAEVAESWNHVLRKFVPEDRMLSADDIRSVMGKTMTEIADTLFPDTEPDLRTRIFDECMAYENAYLEEHGARLFDGVRETLELLRGEGYSMAVVSNCQSGYIRAFMTSMDMDRFFCDFEEWGRTGLTKAENIRLVMERNNYAKGIYIGDTQKDGDASRGAGIPFIHAAYGFGNDSCPDEVISDFRSLPAAAERLVKKDNI